MSFAQSLRNSIKRVQQEVAGKISERVRFVFSCAVTYSPVDTGYFMGNWDVSLNPSVTPKHAAIRKDFSKHSGAPDRRDVYGSMVKAEIVAEVRPELFFKDRTIYMVNNTYYANQIEWLGWVVNGRKVSPHRPVSRAIRAYHTRYV